MPNASVAQFTYRAFISYSHRDKAWADWLHRSLETYRVPSRLVGTTTAHGVIPRRLNPVFRDRDELSSSPELGTKINEALARSENLIAICSPAAAASRWVNEEVLAYKRLGRGDRIFCLIAGGEPNASDLPGRESEECFCPALRFATDADGRPTNVRAEPIAADARAGKDGKPNAKLKLIAGMLDVGFDALKQREQRRQVQRMTAIAGLALVVMAVTIVLAIAALVSRHRAVIAQHEAVIAKQAAVRRQKQAEGLVDFMLGNLSDKLEAESRLDVMQEVDNHAMAYFASLPPTDVNDAALAQRGKALAQIGNVRSDVGQLSGALDAYRAAVAIDAKLAKAEPTNVARQVAWSDNIAWLGLIHYQQGKLRDAVSEWSQARHVLQPSLGQAPDNLPLLQQLTYLDDDLDHALAAQGQPQKALALTTERLELDQRLVKAKPDNEDYIQELGATHNELGRLALQRGELAAAIAEYRTDDEIETRLSTRHPKDNDQRELAYKSRAMLGRTLTLAGDEADGTRDIEQAVAGMTELSQFDPQDTDARDLVALYSTQLSRLQRQNGHVQVANTLDANAITILAELTKKDPTNHFWQRHYAGALTEQAAESHAAGDIDAARTQAQAALHILEPMLAKHPDERETLLATVTAKLLLASMAADPQFARALHEQALETLQAVKADRGDPGLLALRVEALLALAKRADAIPLIKGLWAQGYRAPAFLVLLHQQQIPYPANPSFHEKLLTAATPAGNDVPARASKKQP